MKVGDIASCIEDFAPLEIQESYDNAGLVVGHADDEVTGVLIAVDVTEEVMDEARKLNCSMIVTHHPIVFHPLKRFNSASVEQCCVERAIKDGIALYACHTNLDSAPQGMSWRLGRMLGLRSMSLLQESAPESGAGFGVVGLVDGQSEEEFLGMMKKSLALSVIRHSALTGRKVKRVAVCTGAGGSLIPDARKCGCDVYVTADLKYNDFFSPNGEFVVADIGHFESEKCAMDILFDILSKKFINFALHKSLCSKAPVMYYK